MINPTDAVIALVLLAAAARGAVRGFVAETFGVLAIAAGFAGGVLLAPTLQEWLGADAGLEPSVRAAAAFVAGFFAAYLPVYVIGLAAARFLRRGLAGALNRAGGLVAGSLKWALVLALALVVIDVGAGRDVLPGGAESRLAAVLGDALAIPLRVGDGTGDGAAG